MNKLLSLLIAVAVSRVQNSSSTSANMTYFRVEVDFLPAILIEFHFFVKTFSILLAHTPRNERTITVAMAKTPERSHSSDIILPRRD